MTYTLKRYQSYQEYIEDEDLSPEGNYRLLSTGALIEVPLEDDANAEIISILFASIIAAKGFRFAKFIRPGNKEIQVHPVGDNCVNRKPDLLVLRQAHREKAKQAILLGAPSPEFVAEVVSPGKQTSANYLRDYVWKRQQYQDWQIPEYWIIDPHQQQVTVLNLIDGAYKESIFKQQSVIKSTVFPSLDLSVDALISGQIDN